MRPPSSPGGSLCPTDVRHSNPARARSYRLRPPSAPPLRVDGTSRPRSLPVLIAYTKQQGERAVAGHFQQCLPVPGLFQQLGPVTALKFRPGLGDMAVPATQCIARAQILGLQVQLQRIFSDSAWPPTLHQHAPTILRRGRLINPLDPDLRYHGAAWILMRHRIIRLSGLPGSRGRAPAGHARRVPSPRTENVE